MPEMSAMGTVRVLEKILIEEKSSGDDLLRKIRRDNLKYL